MGLARGPEGGVMGDLVKTTDNVNLLEQVIMGGDLARLSPEQRLTYYQRVCESMGLNPLTQPFQYIKLNGRLTLYATRAAADQLRKLHGVSITTMHVDTEGDMAVVTCSGSDNTGRSDTDVGVVPLKGLVGDARANAVLKAVTKAKRRLTLSLCGLGWLDETEVETIPDAQTVTVTTTGEIADGGKPRHNKKDAPTRPWDAETTKKMILAKARQINDDGKPSQQFIGFVAGRIADLFDGDAATKTAKRHSLLTYVFESASTGALTMGECKALKAWSTDEVKEDDGQTVMLPNEYAVAEAAAIVKAYEASMGQQELVMPEGAP